MEEEYRFRIFQWFNPKEESSLDLGWISFHNLPVQFFTRQALYLLASFVDRLVIDRAITDQIRPATTRVKVGVDLLAALLERVRLLTKEPVSCIK